LVQNNYIISSNSESLDLFKQLDQEKPDLVLLSVIEADDLYSYLKKQCIPFIVFCEADDLTCLDSMFSIC
jgi:hypothetical protein